MRDIFQDNTGGTDEDYEKCVCCHKTMSIPIKTNISERKYYVEGAGQLCQKCHYELYPEYNN